VRRSSSSEAAFAQFPCSEAQQRMLEQIGLFPIRSMMAKIMGALSEAVYTAFCGKMSPEQALLGAKFKVQDILHRKLRR
jgi:maltose-binding protein MalE